MSAPVSLTEAKLFLRVEHEAEDGLIQTLIDAAKARVEGEVGLSLTSTSAAPLRLAVMMMVMRAYERGDGDGEMSAAPVEGWIAPYRVVRL
ncbi:head-tail connector protein [Brevundimonas diminuta]|uniref:head-tail connector protein n=1 Tax=Brevundimonas diminuta TaxID=293 RepID=UPI003F7D60C9